MLTTGFAVLAGLDSMGTNAEGTIGIFDGHTILNPGAAPPGTNNGPSESDSVDDKTSKTGAMLLTTCCLRGLALFFLTFFSTLSNLSCSNASDGKESAFMSMLR